MLAIMIILGFIFSPIPRWLVEPLAITYSVTATYFIFYYFCRIGKIIIEAPKIMIEKIKEIKKFKLKNIPRYLGKKVVEIIKTQPSLKGFLSVIRESGYIVVLATSVMLVMMRLSMRLPHWTFLEEKSSSVFAVIILTGLAIIVIKTVVKFGFQLLLLWILLLIIGRFQPSQWTLITLILAVLYLIFSEKILIYSLGEYAEKEDIDAEIKIKWNNRSILIAVCALSFYISILLVDSFNLGDHLRNLVESITETDSVAIDQLNQIESSSNNHLHYYAIGVARLFVFGFIFAVIFEIIHRTKCYYENYYKFIRIQGKIKYFDPEKGFGFITSAGGEEVFFHITSINNVKKEDAKKIKRGQKVKFKLVKGEKGLKAKDVTLL